MAVALLAAYRTPPGAFVVFFIFFLGGPIQEEPGWRGYLLPKLQETWHPLTAALIVGVIHCFWYVPLFFTSVWDTPRTNYGEYVAYLILVVALSVILTWLYNTSGLVVVIIGHNLVNWVMAGVIQASSTWPAAIALTTGAVLLASYQWVFRSRPGAPPSESPSS